MQIVFELLAANGKMTAADIATFTRLSRREVKDCLRRLHRKGCIEVHAQAPAWDVAPDALPMLRDGRGRPRGTR